MILLKEWKAGHRNAAGPQDWRLFGLADIPALSAQRRSSHFSLSLLLFNLVFSESASLQIKVKVEVKVLEHNERNEGQFFILSIPSNLLRTCTFVAVTAYIRCFERVHVLLRTRTFILRTRTFILQTRTFILRTHSIYFANAYIYSANVYISFANARLFLRKPYIYFQNVHIYFVNARAHVFPHAHIGKMLSSCEFVCTHPWRFSVSVSTCHF